MTKKLAGYRSKLVVRAGDEIDFMVHCEEPLEYEADLIRIINGDADPAGPGLVFEEIDAPFAGRRSGLPQDRRAGSLLVAPLAGRCGSELTLAFAVQPTFLSGREQTLAELTDTDGVSIVRIWIDAGGRLCAAARGASAGDASSGDVFLALEKQIPLDRWSFVTCLLDGAVGSLRLAQQPRPVGPADLCLSMQDEGAVLGKLPADWRPALLTMASGFDPERKPRQPFNGKIEAPRLSLRVMPHAEARALVLAEAPPDGDPSVIGFWDFSRDIDSRAVSNLALKGRPGEVVNLPTRAMRGFRWTGDGRDWRAAPREYGAIHFHETDVYDLQWEKSFSYVVADQLRSGAYAVRLRHGEETEYLTFFVSPSPDKRPGQPPIAFVAPTASYLAYANERAHVMVVRALYGDDAPLLPEVQQLIENPSFGLSMYEAHPDGSGVAYASHLRPLWNLRPDTRPWAFPADTNIIHWLETEGFDYDVITDHDLAAHGASILNNYAVAIAGTHPEYLDDAIYDAYERFLTEGGRLMYLGGNGFYWRVAFSEHWPEAMEVRRAEDGNRGWVAEPGEYRHAFDGAMGGLWRRQARAPNRLVGVGFTAQGFTVSTHYRRTAASNDARCAFVFEGVEDEIIGDFGLRGGGAAGEEIDRFDIALGSPAHGLVMAMSEDHPPDMFLAKEEFLFTLVPNTDPRIHADLVFYETASGGAVFSTGSIAWAGALSHNGFSNNVATITGNVLRRFCDPEPFEAPPAPKQRAPSERASVPGGQRISG